MLLSVPKEEHVALITEKLSLTKKTDANHEQPPASPNNAQGTRNPVVNLRSKSDAFAFPVALWWLPPPTTAPHCGQVERSMAMPHSPMV